MISAAARGSKGSRERVAGTRLVRRVGELASMRITFQGAAGCVTGSRFLVESEGARLLVDCGLFQGHKVLRKRNWRPFACEPSGLDAVLLTHAHIDHSGMLPALVRDGFRGQVHCTRATRDLCRILLPDAGRIQEEDARYANEKGFSKHHPARPLFTEDDARRSLRHLRPAAFDETLELGDLRARFRRAGHILGAASIELESPAGTVLFSGDLGRSNDLLMYPPEPPGDVDWVVMESTYGDRLHPDVDPLDALAEPLGATIERGGVALIPSFAVGRTQSVLLAIRRLFASGRLPEVPVFVDSPMATDVTELYREHADLHRLDPDESRQVFSMPRYARSVEESKDVVAQKGARIVISASGMLTGGRVLHHLKELAPHAGNTILLPGFQAPGTRGAQLAQGASRVRVHGEWVPVRAEVRQLGLLSAHADQRDLLAWLAAAPRDLRGVLLVHGEPDALDTLRVEIGEQQGRDADVPDHGETIELA